MACSRELLNEFTPYRRSSRQFRMEGWEDWGERSRLCHPIGAPKVVAGSC